MSSKLRNIFSDRDLNKEKPMAKSPKSPKTRDREKDVEKDKEKRRYSRPTQKRASTSTKDRDSTMTTSSTSSSHTHTRTRTRRSSMPEIDSNTESAATSFLESRSSLPYPAFSKAHSKVALWDKHEALKKTEIPTPDPTDVDNHEGRKTTSRNGHRHGTPPSPPLTAEQRSTRKGSSTGSKQHKDREKDSKTKTHKDPTRSTSSLGPNTEDGSRLGMKSPRPNTPSKVRIRDSSTPHRTVSHKDSRTSQSTDIPKRAASKNLKSPANSLANSVDNVSQYTTDSDATSIAPNQPKPPSQFQSRTPRRQSPAVEVFIEEDESAINGEDREDSPSLPPPPPPPPEMPVAPPRVDYLLQNGGLPYQIPKQLLGAGQPQNVPQQLFQTQNAIVEAFEPYHRLLDDYNKVMSKNGSLAVATGYRSVARRLLDRLEAVFARDISSEACQCVMCENYEAEEPSPGVSWGEVLELVSGRRELPSWPPFHMPTPEQDPLGPGEEHIPMQKLDIDVPEEYREHYVRQSRKTKQAVDKWLLGQTDSTVPEEVDDETLSFAMMTYLTTEQREIFCALMGIKSSTPVPRSTTPAPRPRPEPLVASTLGIQRLYRLATPARDSETALFMLKNPLIHNVLATLAAISEDEWEILISGRFDGFLRSGAEDTFSPSRSASRAGTPFPPPFSRGPTPFQGDPIHRPMSQPYGSSVGSASYGAPIGLDEDTEIAVLAEIEKNIFQSMEALEDAFEALHCKAEVVRRALRERGAGLSVANQARRGSGTNLDARLGTPASMAGSLWESGLDDDDGIDDDMSLMPDDSASNISSNRRRRPKRRSERRTPAPVEEEDEEEDLDDYNARRTRRR